MDSGSSCEEGALPRQKENGACAWVRVRVMVGPCANETCKP